MTSMRLIAAVLLTITGYATAQIKCPNSKPIRVPGVPATGVWYLSKAGYKGGPKDLDECGILEFDSPCGCPLFSLTTTSSILDNPTYYTRTSYGLNTTSGEYESQEMMLYARYKVAVYHWLTPAHGGGLQSMNVLATDKFSSWIAYTECYHGDQWFVIATKSPNPSEDVLNDAMAGFKKGYSGDEVEWTTIDRNDCPPPPIDGSSGAANNQ